MAAPVYPSPPWEDDGGWQWVDDGLAPPPREDPRGWVDDELAPFLDDLTGRDPAREETERWAVPGLPIGDSDSDCDSDCDSGGGLSRATVSALAEARASWEALRRVQARCYRALTALEACDAVGETGYRSTARLLTDHVRIDPSEGRRLARHARALTTTVSPSGAGLGAALPATAEQVTAGLIGPGHVEVIRTTMRRLSAVPGLGPDVLATTEAQLAELAAIHSPAGLAEAAAAIEALLDPDGAAPDDQPSPANELHYLRRTNGNLVGRFTYRDPAAAEALHIALTAATPPADPTPEPIDGEPRGESFGTQAARTLPERRAHALLDLVGEALTRGLNTADPADPADPAQDAASPGLFDEDTDDVESVDRDSEPAPDQPPGWTRADVEGGERVALTVTLNYETLRAALAEPRGPGDGFTGRLALLGENTYVRPDTARRLACDAELIPAVLGSRGEILDLGRKMRIVSQALRRAVILRDRHCAHPGCRRRARRCQVHHICHWADGGESCLENCVLLCSYHHQLIHHSGWEVHMIDGLPLFTPPAWLDPLRRPRHNRPWHDQQTA
jgi:hypothetical protein